MNEPLEGVLEEWTQKVTLTVGERRFSVPENQDVIRIFQYLGCLDALDFFSGLYCWNATCDNCVFTYRDPATGSPVTKRACQTRVFDGLEVLALPKDVRLK